MKFCPEEDWMKGKPLIAALSVIFFAALVYVEEPGVFTDSDLVNIKQVQSLDEDSLRRREAELTSYEEQREPEYRQKSALNDKEKAEKETCAV